MLFSSTRHIRLGPNPMLSLPYVSWNWTQKIAFSRRALVLNKLQNPSEALLFDLSIDTEFFTSTFRAASTRLWLRVPVNSIIGAFFVASDFDRQELDTQSKARIFARVSLLWVQPQKCTKVVVLKKKVKIAE